MSARKFWYKACVQIFVCSCDWLCRYGLIRREYGSFLHNSFLGLRTYSSYSPCLQAPSPSFQPISLPFPDQMRWFASIRWQVLTCVDMCWRIAVKWTYEIAYRNRRYTYGKLHKPGVKRMTLGLFHFCPKSAIIQSAKGRQLMMTMWYSPSRTGRKSRYRE